MKLCLVFFRVILGRSHIKAVAENRKTEIEKFLGELFQTSPEISHVSKVSTFWVIFHAFVVVC